MDPNYPSNNSPAPIGNSLDGLSAVPPSPPLSPSAPQSPDVSRPISPPPAPTLDPVNVATPTTPIPTQSPAPQAVTDPMFHGAPAAPVVPPTPPQPTSPTNPAVFRPTPAPAVNTMPTMPRPAAVPLTRLAPAVPAPAYDQVTSSPAPVTKPKLGKNKKLLTTLGIVGIIAVTSIFMITKYILPTLNGPKYSQLQPVTFTADDGTKVNLDLPDKMKEDRKIDSGVIYTHSNDKQEKYVETMVSAQAWGAKLQPTDVEKAIADVKQNAGTADFGREFQAYFDDSIRDLSFSAARDFNNDHFKQGIVSDLNFVDSGGAKVTGQIAIMADEENLFIVMIDAPEDIWNKNLANWQKVFASVKPQS